MKINRGIYKIINKINGKFYIGSAVNIKKRWSQHKCLLNKNKHGNNKLQNSWNKYGKDSFSFHILCIVDKDENLIPIEQLYLDWYKPYEVNMGYNICKIAGSALGIKRSDEFKKKMSIAAQNMSEEHKKNLSKSLKGRKLGENTKKKISEFQNRNNSWLGKKHSEESKRKMSKSQKKRWNKRLIS